MVILYEDDEVLVIRKPAGTATEAAKVSERDMVSEVNNYLYKNSRRAGKSVGPAFLIHRLDKPVEGILVFAKTKNAAANLNKQITENKFNKHYYALVCGTDIGLESQKLINYIKKDNKLNKAIVCSEDEHEKDKNVKRAELIYEVVNNKDAKEIFGYEGDDTILLDIKLLTGRFHQIRAQLSNLGVPILGDTLYGGKPIEKRNCICLKAYKLEFIHPKTHKQMTFDIT